MVFPETPSSSASASPAQSLKLEVATKSAWCVVLKPSPQKVTISLSEGGGHVVIDFLAASSARR
jgi:hypothetical protein